MAAGLEYIRRELAATLGLPFAFASHFAPALLFEAIHAYRFGFKPSVYLDKPYLAAGIPLVAAESDQEAGRLATAAFERHLKLLRGEPIFVPAPQKNTRQTPMTASKSSDSARPHQNL
jgi:alkanesulfonate monooxygenase SsuD/methylene tetrahydromethanopterin reductase-like flavin-dependent oxidoreductase (luciferase family)